MAFEGRFKTLKMLCETGVFQSKGAVSDRAKRRREPEGEYLVCVNYLVCVYDNGGKNGRTMLLVQCVSKS